MSELEAADLLNQQTAPHAKREEDDDDEDDRKGGRERRKIEIKFIQDKSRRHITFSKRKAGIMKKAYELSVLTGTQVLLLVVSETGLVYTFTTPKLQPLVTENEGKNLIQACLNAPEKQPSPPPQQAAAPSSAPGQVPLSQPANGHESHPGQHLGDPLMPQGIPQPLDDPSGQGQGQGLSNAHLQAMAAGGGRGGPQIGGVYMSPEHAAASYNPYMMQQPQQQQRYMGHQPHMNHQQ